MYIRLFTILFLLLTTEQVVSQQHDNFKNINQPPNPFNFTYTSSDQYSYHGQFATWYVEINIDQLRKYKILEVLNGKNIIFSENSKISFNDAIPKGINKIWLYGNSLKRSGEVNLFFHGEFHNSTILDFLKERVYVVNNISQLKQVNSRTYNGKEIYVFEMNTPDKKNKKKYAARLADDSFIFSNNIHKVKHLIENLKANKKRSIDKKENQNTDNGLLIMSLDNEIALNNAQLNNDDEYVIQSQLFKKSKKIIATIHMQDSYLILNSTLESKSNEVALQIEKIINGILAVNSINDEDPKSIKSRLINNFVINTDDENVYFRTFLPAQLFFNYK